MRLSPTPTKVRNNGEFATRVVLEGGSEWCQGAIQMKKTTLWAMVTWLQTNGRLSDTLWIAIWKMPNRTLFQILQNA